MSLCTSGDLSILGTAGTNRSIACEVDGNVTPPKSLCSLSVSAGKTAPHAMTEFYGYSNYKCIEFNNLSGTPTESYDEIISSPSMSAGECYNISLSWSLCTVGSKSNACVYVYCNGTTKYSCAATSDQSCSGTFSTFTIDDNDNVCTCIHACKGLGGTCARASISISTVTGVVGSFCKGSPTFVGVLDA